MDASTWTQACLASDAPELEHPASKTATPPDSATAAVMRRTVQTVPRPWPERGVPQSRVVRAVGHSRAIDVSRARFLPLPAGTGSPIDIDRTRRRGALHRPVPAPATPG